MSAPSASAGACRGAHRLCPLRRNPAARSNCIIVGERALIAMKPAQAGVGLTAQPSTRAQGKSRLVQAGLRPKPAARALMLLPCSERRCNTASSSSRPTIWAALARSDCTTARRPLRQRRAGLPRYANRRCKPDKGERRFRGHPCSWRPCRCIGAAPCRRARRGS